MARNTVTNIESRIQLTHDYPNDFTTSTNRDPGLQVQVPSQVRFSTYQILHPFPLTSFLKTVMPALPIWNSARLRVPENEPREHWDSGVLRDIASVGIGILERVVEGRPKGECYFPTGLKSHTRQKKRKNTSSAHPPQSRNTIASCNATPRKKGLYSYSPDLNDRLINQNEIKPSPLATENL